MGISIEEFRSEGELETQGQFRLDETAAREKLQQYRLKDPHAWVLELVRAAHIGEAVSIAFEIGPGKMSCMIDGLEIPAEIARDWAHAPFEELGSKEARVLRHVAIALATLQGLQPKRVAFEAGLGTDRVRIEIENGQERVIDAPPYLSTNTYTTGGGIRVESEGKFAFGMKRFFESIVGELSEVSHLKRSCQYPLIPLFINEQRFGKPMHIEESDNIPIESPVEVGVLGLRDRGIRHLCIYQHGVLLEESVEPVLGVWKGFDALVSSTRVGTDLGGQQIIRDKRFEALQELIELTWCRAVERRVDSYRSRHSGNLTVLRTDPTLRAFARQTIQAVELARIGKATIPPGLERLAAEFDQHQIWPLMLGDKERYVSIDDLRQIDGRRLHYVTTVFSEQYLKADELVLIARRDGDAVWVEDVSIKALEYRLDRKMYDVSGELRERESTALNRERWRRSPVVEPKLNGLLASTVFRHLSGDACWEIEVGFSYRAGSAEAVWIKEGRLLSRHRVKGPDIAISISGDIPANATFTGPEPRSKQVRSAAVRTVEVVLDLAIDVLQGRVKASDSFDLTSSRLTEMARLVVFAAISGDLVNFVFSVLGFKPLQGKDIEYSERIRAGASDTMSPAERIEALGPILKVPLLWRPEQDRGMSLVSLESLIDGPERIFYEHVVSTGSLGSRQEDPSGGPVDWSVLALTDWEFRGLNRLLEARLIPYRVANDVALRDALSETLGAEAERKDIRPEPHSTPFEIPPHLLSPDQSKRPSRHNEPFLDGLADWILGQCSVVFGEPNIRGLRRVRRDGRQVARVVDDHVELDSTHPVVELATKNPGDVILKGMLGCSVYTVVNCHFLSVEDHHEHTFLNGVIEEITV